MTTAVGGWPTETCSGCGQPIVWATTTRRRPMPVDPEPAIGGNVWLFSSNGMVHAEVVVNPARLFGRATHMSHFATCPNAADFRLRGRRSPR